MVLGRRGRPNVNGSVDAHRDELVLERPRKGDPIALALSPTRVPDFHAPENAAILHLRPGSAP